MYLFLESSYYLIQLSCYNQVLAGVLPYHGSKMADMIANIRAGKRPSRPIDPSQSQLLQGPVWGVITTGWRDKPRQRCDLPVMYRVFSNPLPNQWQQLGKILPRVASFFQFLQNSGSEIQSQVDEMNQVGSPTHPLPEADMIHSVLRMVRCRIESD